MASAPIPQPRSATRRTPAWTYRLAWTAETLSRVACSRPSWVKSMCWANSPNLAAAAVRSRDWVMAAEISSGANPSARSREICWRASSSR